MKKFKFRLQRVLQHRSNVVDEHRRVLVESNVKLSKAQQHLEQLEESFINSNVEQSQIVSVENFLMAGLFIERLRLDIANQMSACARAEEGVQRALVGYLEAKKEEQALVKLKERKLKEYKERAEREDQHSIDELVTQRLGLQRAAARKDESNSIQVSE